MRDINKSDLSVFLLHTCEKKYVQWLMMIGSSNIYMNAQYQVPFFCQDAFSSFAGIPGVTNKIQYLLCEIQPLIFHTKA